MTNEKDYRLPAEWEKQECVLISWPHPGTDWKYMINEAEECFAKVAQAIAQRTRLLIVCPDKSRPLKKLQGKIPADRIRIFELPTNDTWTRDFGPITLLSDKEPIIAMYQFNGWGLKYPANHDNLVTSALWLSGSLCNEAFDHTSFVLEGGSIDCDGNGIILTTEECLLSPNRHGMESRDEIEDALMRDLNLEHVIWLEHGYLEGDDTDSHVDTLARFLPGDKIAYTACDRPDDEHYKDLKLMEQELKAINPPSHPLPFRLVPLPIPEPIMDKKGNRLPATYANFLILNGAILLPVYADEKYDAIAVARLKEACPGYEIVPIDCRALIQQHGSLHCITMQLPFVPKIFTDKD